MEFIAANVDRLLQIDTKGNAFMDAYMNFFGKVSTHNTFLTHAILVKMSRVDKCYRKGLVKADI